MSTTEITPDALAIEVLDSIPLVMYFIRKQARQCNTIDISVPQIRVLAYLRLAPGASLTQLAENLGVTKATASNLIDRMVQRQLVMRCENTEERRSVKLTITKDGEQHLQEARAMVLKGLANNLEKVAQEKRRKISEGVCLLRELFRLG